VATTSTFWVHAVEATSRRTEVKPGSVHRVAM
jgi:hypothetical protein